MGAMRTLNLFCINLLNHLLCTQALEEAIQEMETSHQVGPLLLVMEKLRLALIAEANAWKQMYGRYLNERCAKQMDDTLDFFNEMEKRLSRPVKDLDDIRSHMGALREIREKEIEIDMTIAPIEEAYILLGKYNLAFNDGNPERVDSLSYGWSKLTDRVRTGEFSYFDGFFCICLFVVLFIKEFS